MKNVLVASLGGAPQVITEALWALMNPAGSSLEKVFPAEIHIAATAFIKGFDSLAAREQIVREKIFELYREHKVKAPIIHPFDIVRDQNGIFFDDVSTQIANELYGDLIKNIVSKISASEDVSIHMLLSGGRKSMSSYDQSAMMLFGRSQDKIYHVFVSPENIIGASDFWWPTQKLRQFEQPDFDASKPPRRFDIDRQPIAVWLVSVPFLPVGIDLTQGHDLKNISYAEIVRYFAESRADLKYEIDTETRKLSIGDYKVSFPPAEFSLLMSLVTAKTEGWPGFGAGGPGGNQAGWVGIDDYCGKNPRGLTVMEEYWKQQNREHSGTSAKVSSGLGIIDSGGAAAIERISELRSKINKAISKSVSNVFIRNRLMLGTYPPSRGRRKSSEAAQVCFGLKISAETIVVKPPRALKK